MMTDPNTLFCLQDNKVTDFIATIAQVRQTEDKTGFMVRLDKSYFFPAGGGQPADRGTINTYPVSHVTEENGAIWHFIDHDPGTVEADCHIDAPWRLHFMRQHSGQHLISGALWKLAEIQTVSVHLGEEKSTIETNLPLISDETISEVENQVNELIMQNLPIQTILTHSNELEQYPLRKAPPVSGPLRLVAVGDFDYSVCCGLHLTHTGELGTVKCVGSEKIRGHIRTNWLIGKPALLDYQYKHGLIQHMKKILSCSSEELVYKTSQVMEEKKQLIRDSALLETRLSAEIVRSLMQAVSEDNHNPRVMSHIFNESEQLVSQVVKKLLNEKHLIFCIVNQGKDNFSWNIGKTADMAFDFDEIRDALLLPVSGKGGGRAPLWKGTAEDPAKTALFVSTFKSLLNKTQPVAHAARRST